MLLIEGAKYERWVPTDEKAFERIIKEHSKDIFGADSLYLDLKHKLQGAEIAAIPDAYVITLDPDKLWIIEIEISTHDVYQHIMLQLGKFLAALKKSSTKESLRNALFKEIEAQTDFKNILKQKGEVFKFLSDLLNVSPEIVVIIDEWIAGLDDIGAALKADVKICEFDTFYRRDAGIADHAHAFEPVGSKPVGDYQALWQTLLDGTRSKGIPLGWRASKGRYQKIASGKAGIHFEWLAYQNELGVELHFELSDVAHNKQLLKVFERRKLEIEKSVGESIEFDSAFHKKWTRLIISKKAPENEAPPQIGEEVKHWAVETMVRLYKVCKPILDELET